MSRYRTLPRWLTAIIVGLFFFHFLMVGLFQFAKGVLPSAAVKVVTDYNIPWFYQNYLMFAPDPTSRIHTFVYRVQSDGEWSQWKNPIYPYQQQHWANRFSTGSDMYDMIGGMADALFNGAELINASNDLSDSLWHAWPGFIVAERYVLKHGSIPTDEVEALEVGVLTEEHFITDEGNVRRFHVFQSYPVKRIKQ